MGFPGGSVVKNLPAMQRLQKMQVQSLGQEHPLEEGMTTLSSILAQRIPWIEEPGGLQFMESQRVIHDWSNLAHNISLLNWRSLWVFFGRNDAKAETPVLWPPHAKSWLIGKDSEAGRDWGQEENRPTEDEMAGWHHWLDGRESEWTPGVGDGQGGLACCNSWGRKESDTTERLNWTELIEHD